MVDWLVSAVSGLPNHRETANKNVKKNGYAREGHGFGTASSSIAIEEATTVSQSELCDHAMQRPTSRSHQSKFHLRPIGNNMPHLAWPDGVLLEEHVALTHANWQVPVTADAEKICLRLPLTGEGLVWKAFQRYTAAEDPSSHRPVWCRSVTFITLEVLRYVGELKHLLQAALQAAGTCLNSEPAQLKTTVPTCCFATQAAQHRAALAVAG